MCVTNKYVKKGLFCISLSITPYPSPMKSIQKSTEHYLMDGFTIYVHQEGSANFAFYPYQICRKRGVYSFDSENLRKAGKWWMVWLVKDDFKMWTENFTFISFYELSLQVDPCNPGPVWCGICDYILRNFSSTSFQSDQR